MWNKLFLECNFFSSYFGQKVVALISNLAANGPEHYFRSTFEQTYETDV